MITMSDIRGYGGRIGSPTFDLTVLNGVRTTDFTDAPKLAEFDERHCANTKCRKLFTPRAEGEDFCSEACDFDANPRFKPRTKGNVT